MPGKFLTEGPLESLIEELSAVTVKKNFGKSFFERDGASAVPPKKKATKVVKRRAALKKK